MIYTPMTVKAMRLAYEAHNGQFDKNGVPYVFHPIHLAEQMENEITCTIALLHDVVEDTEITLAEIREQFPPEVADAVELMTHSPDVDYFEYVRGIKANENAIKVKLADLAHNSDETRAKAGDPIDEKKRREMLSKYEKAKRILTANE